MSTQFVQQVSGDGLRLPRELIEQWGARAGQEVIVQCERDMIRIVPAEWDADRIAETAATYVLDYVGDAAAVEPPQRVGDRWRVPVVLSYRAKQLGTLTYSLRGELVPDASDSPQAMRDQSRED
jgi:antitoxin component of MazEF toxin-antitoxin module